MAKNWGKIDSSGNLVGKPCVFPPVPGIGERVSYKNVIAHNSEDTPAKVFLKISSILDGTCVANFVPGTPGSWDIHAWGDSGEKILRLVHEVLTQLGLA